MLNVKIFRLAHKNFIFVLFTLFQLQLENLLTHLTLWTTPGSIPLPFGLIIIELPVTTIKPTTTKQSFNIFFTAETPFIFLS